MNKLELKNVTKSFSDLERPAVNNINLSIKDNEIVTLLGPSGCGKTTILRMIAGFERPDKGEVLINGERVFSSNTWVPPEKRKIGMVFQDYALFPHLTVKENISFGAEKNKNKEERTAQLLELVGLEDYADRAPHQLSGGQQQRVALARALMNDPVAVLLDEPFSNLDEKLKLNMRKEVKNILKESNTTAIFVTHDQEDALSLSDRIAVIKDGKIQQIDTPYKVFRKPKTEFVASFVTRANLLKGNIDREGKLQTDIGELCFLDCDKNKDNFTVAARPDAFKVDANGPIEGTITDYVYMGNYIEADFSVTTGKGEKQLKIYLDGNEAINIGSKINLSCNSEACCILDKE